MRLFGDSREIDRAMSARKESDMMRAIDDNCSFTPTQPFCSLGAAAITRGATMTTENRKLIHEMIGPDMDFLGGAPAY